MRTSVVVAIFGAILFAVGIIGSAVLGRWARTMDPDYVYDCLVGDPAPDCESRVAARQTADTMVLAVSLLIPVGLVVIVAGFVMDVRRKRRAPPRRVPPPA